MHTAFWPRSLRSWRALRSGALLTTLVAAGAPATTLLAQAPTERVAPTQRLDLTSDTLRWRIPELSLDGRALFSELDSVNTWNNDVDGEKPPFTFRLTGGAQPVSCPTAGQTKVTYPIDVVRNGTTKRLRVIMWPSVQRVRFSTSYQQQHRGKIVVEIPAVFELTLIALALTDAGSSDGNLTDLNKPYYQAVKAHFGPFSNHALIRYLNEQMRSLGAYNAYGTLRTDSYGYEFVGDRIRPKESHQFLGYRLHLNHQLALWEDFARKSGFRSFFAKHQPYYDQVRASVTRRLDVAAQWTWLEARFPNRYDHYKIVLSPLIQGYHNTTRYENGGFRECLMFVCDDAGHDPKKYTERVWSGLYTGIVFTEIDHNYVNPVSDKYGAAIRKSFGDRAFWTRKGSSADGYGSAYAVFNEYMTHAAYLLFIKDHYTPDEFAQVRERRTALMERRGFPQFDAFTTKLLALYAQPEHQRDLTTTYRPLLDWGAQQQQTARN